MNEYFVVVEGARGSGFGLGGGVGGVGGGGGGGGSGLSPSGDQISKAAQNL